LRHFVVSIIGLGYVGLTTAAALASKDFRVAGYDIDDKKVKRINNGDPTFHEPGLKELLKNGLEHGFEASDKLKKSDIYFVTVGTPSMENGNTDLTYVKSASESLGTFLKNSNGYSVVAVKSTVTPGTTEGLVRSAIESPSGRTVGRGLGLVSNPEFLREGSAVEDTLSPDRLVIGEMDKKSGGFVAKMYREFYGPRMPKVLRTTPVNAELIKYASNAFLATKVSFINMIANLCRVLPGADVEAVAEGTGLDKRIGGSFLRAGAGWGGSCWPKDLKALEAVASSLGVGLPIVEAAIAVNEAQPNEVVTLAKTLTGTLAEKRVAVLGLSFKPNTDDVREAISIKVVNSLLNQHAWVNAYDPAAMENAKKVFENLPEERKNRLTFAHSALDAMKGTDCCIVVTEWDQFRKLKPSDFKTRMRRAALVDGRRIYDPKIFARELKFAAIGLGVVSERQNPDYG